MQIYVFYKIWEIFSHLFKYFFNPTPFLLSSWGSNAVDIRSFVLVLWIPEALLTFSSLFFCLLFKLAKFYCSALKFIDFSSVPSILLLSPYCFFFNFRIFFLKFQFDSFLYFLRILFLAENFYFICFKCFLDCSWKHIYDDCFKIFAS